MRLSVSQVSLLSVLLLLCSRDDNCRPATPGINSNSVLLVNSNNNYYFISDLHNVYDNCWHVEWFTLRLISSVVSRRSRGTQSSPPWASTWARASMWTSPLSARTRSSAPSSPAAASTSSGSSPGSTSGAGARVHQRLVCPLHQTQHGEVSEHLWRQPCSGSAQVSRNVEDY